MLTQIRKTTFFVACGAIIYFSLPYTPFGRVLFGSKTEVKSASTTSSSVANQKPIIPVTKSAGDIEAERAAAETTKKAALEREEAAQRDIAASFAERCLANYKTKPNYRMVETTIWGIAREQAVPKAVRDVKQIKSDSTYGPSLSACIPYTGSWPAGVKPIVFRCYMDGGKIQTDLQRGGYCM